MPEQPRLMNSTSSERTFVIRSRPGLPTPERSQMAGLMIADARVQGLMRARELAPGVEAEQVLADVHGVGGDQLGIEILGELDVLFLEHERGGRLGTDDGVPVADGVGQDAQVDERLVARMIDVADDQGGHARAPLTVTARTR